MKISCLRHALLAVAMLAVLFDAATRAAQGSQPTQPTLPADTAYTVTERGANYRIWEKTSYELGPNGTVVPRKHHYTELASGMHYQVNGEWVESKEIIEPYASGAVARQGQYQVIFANNLNTAGAIDQQTPDGKRLRSNILGLEYYDTVSGKSALIAQVQDSQGQLIAANQVLYTNAFAGVNADVQYTYKKGSFEQDVILREQPPTPESYGLDSATTVLEVITEFINPPAAKIGRHQHRGEALPDDDVSWGTMRLGHGKAFDLGHQNVSAERVSVTKRYLQIQGRQVLLEEVPLDNIQSDLSGLPQQSSRKSHLPKLAAKNLMLPQPVLAQAKQSPMKLAAAPTSSQGYVLDYVEIDANQGDYVFQGDLTYFISGVIYLTGNVIIEGGTVVKYDVDADNPSINLFEGNLTCATGPYRPAVFTSQNDNTVGEYVGNGGGLQYFQAIAINPDINVQLQYVRVCYALTGIHTTSINVSDSQLVDCQYPIDDEWGTCNMTNVLMVNSGVAFYGTQFNINAYHVTIDGCSSNVLCNDWAGPTTNNNVLLVNSLLVNAGADGDGTITTNYTARVTGSSSDYFQSVLGGECYLPTNSPYLGAGTTNIDPGTLADINAKTTYPPTVYANATISPATTFGPIVPRDTNNTPSLGYHYDPLDYAFAETEVDSNVTFTAGTAVGWYRVSSGDNDQGDGMHLMNQATADFNGTATSPCWWVRLNTVQEADASAGSGPGGLTSWGVSNVITKATINARFLKCSGMNYDANHFRDDDGNNGNALLEVNATHCEFYGINVSGYAMAENFTNCLFNRATVGVDSRDSNCDLTMQNCDMIGGDNSDVSVTHEGPSVWPVYIVNCAFVNCDFTWVDNIGAYNYDYNAYVEGDQQLTGGGVHDVVVTNFNWQSSWFGDFYLSTNSPLIDAGSTTADQVGLYHFTTQTNQTVEGDSTVDIGYHYVATDAFGNPLDSNGDGIPDYLEDANGNGIFDTGDLGEWVSPYGLGGTNQLEVFTPLK